MHIGSGSNLLFINDFNGVILHSQIKGISVAKETDDLVLLRIGAGVTSSTVLNINPEAIKSRNPNKNIQ